MAGDEPVVHLQVLVEEGELGVGLPELPVQLLELVCGLPVALAFFAHQLDLDAQLLNSLLPLLNLFAPRLYFSSEFLDDCIFLLQLLIQVLHSGVQ